MNPHSPIAPRLDTEAMQGIRTACTEIGRLSHVMTEEELKFRERLVDTLVRTRRAAEQMRQRAQTLQDGLDRFKQQRSASTV